MGQVVGYLGELPGTRRGETCIIIIIVLNSRDLIDHLVGGKKWNAIHYNLKPKKNNETATSDTAETAAGRIPGLTGKITSMEGKKIHRHEDERIKVKVGTYN
jgi:hypothetical protein